VPPETATPEPLALPAAGDAEPCGRTSAFILLRFTLLIATSYMLLAEEGFSKLSPLLSAWIAVGLLSNLAATRLPRPLLESRAFTAGSLVADTLWITVGLLVTGHFEAEFFYLYFFVLFLAAVGESLALIALGTVLVSAAYLYTLSASGAGSILETSTLIRLPFLFTVASFYGYLVDRVRRERQRATTEAETVVRLEEVRRNLETANQRLEREAAERRRAEAALQLANRELAKLSELKSAFVSTVSHELRTPLTSIKNAIDLIRTGKAGPLTPHQVRFLDMAKRNQDRLAAIIDDLLDLSRIEAGRLEYRFEELDAASLLAEVREAFEPLAIAAEVTLEVEAADPAPVLADPKRLTQVLTNLAGNALKFTPAGGRVTLSARAVGPWIELAVTDTGPGIPESDRERIFEPFFQSHGPGRDHLTRTARGTGLGLSISRELARAQGGELTLESTPGVGSRFAVRLPADLLRARESAAFEEEVREHRKYPFFSLLVIGWDAAELAGAPLRDRGSRLSALLALRDEVRQALPRDCDLVRVQPAHGRIVLVLLATPGDGSEVVRRRLERRLANTAIRIDGSLAPNPKIHGPALYPDDGESGRALIEECLARASRANGAGDHSQSSSAPALDGTWAGRPHRPEAEPPQGSIGSPPSPSIPPPPSRWGRDAPSRQLRLDGGQRPEPKGDDHEHADHPGGGRRAGRAGGPGVPAPAGRVRGDHGARRPGGPRSGPGELSGPDPARRDDAEGERVSRLAHAARG
jgi:signal transduction histidine kinase